MPRKIVRIAQPHLGTQKRAPARNRGGFSASRRNAITHPEFSVHPENPGFTASIDKIVSTMGTFVFLFRLRCRPVV